MKVALKCDPPTGVTSSCPPTHIDSAKAPGSHIEDVEARRAMAHGQARFESLWPTITNPDRLILFGFRRFRTSHLLNLRVLEQQIMEVDQIIFEAGLELGDVHAGRDRLALAHAASSSSRRPGPPVARVDEQLLDHLRTLLQQYDDALAAFNRIMTMETLCLADHKELASQSKLTREEAYRTRLLVVDRPPRAAVRDPIQHAFRKVFRRLSFRLTQAWAITALDATATEAPFPSSSSSSLAAEPRASNVPVFDVEAVRTTDKGVERRPRFPAVHVAWLADVVSRLFFGLLASTLLIAPIAILLYQPADTRTQLAIIALFTFVFTLIVALTSRATPQETMVASASYAAVLVVFISNVV